MCQDAGQQETANNWINQGFANEGISPGFNLSGQWEKGDPGIAGGIGERAAGQGVAGILGTIAGLALAPETGGLSLALPAGIGALSGVGGNLLGDLFSGSGVDPLGLAASGLGGAITGGIGGEVFGGAGGATAGDTAAGGADPFGALSVNPDLEGVAAQGIQAGAGPAISSAPALTGGDLAGSAVGSFTAGQPTFGAGPGGVTDALGTTSPDALGTVADYTGGTASAAPGGAISPDVGTTSPDALGRVSDYTGGKGGILNNIQGWLGRNKNLVGPASILASLGKSALFPTKVPGQDMLNSNAGLARNIAETNANGLNPAQQALSQQQLNGQIAAIKAKYAQLGLSGSTAEQQDIAHIQNANLAASSRAITDNSNTALSAIGAANASTLPIAQQQLADDKALSEAIALAAAMSLYGAGGGTQQASQ